MQESVKKAILPVEGMACASCAIDLEKQLLASGLVIDAQVNFANHEAVLTFTPDTALETLQTIANKAGFNLLTESYSFQELSNKKLHAFNIAKKQAWLMAGLSLPVVIIGMFLMHWHLGLYISALLSFPVVFILGKKYFLGAYKQLLQAKANMDTLIALGAGISYLQSVYSLFLYTFANASSKAMPNVYFEAAAIIVTFVSIGKLLEERAKLQTGLALNSLLALQPKEVVILRPNGQEKVVPLHTVKQGNLIVCKTGMQLAVDGVVTDGEAELDERAINGEPLPITKTKGEKVFAGSININGYLIVKAQAVGKATILGQVITQVQHAQASKAPVQAMVDKVASVFVPTVLIIAFATAFFWYFYLGSAHMNMAINFAISVLVIACPCALGLATPAALMVAMGTAAKNHILIKDIAAMQAASKVKNLLFDKTGTLTLGQPAVFANWYAETITETDFATIQQVLQLSNHPLSKSTLSFLQQSNNIFEETIKIEAFEETPGKGLTSMVNNKKWRIGNKTLMDDALFPENSALPHTHDPQIWVCVQNEVIAAFWLTDALNESAKNAIATLQSAGYGTIMLTGDNALNAAQIAQQLGISTFYAACLPQEKAKIVAQYQKKNAGVAMIGDGINDSEAMSQAELSISMAFGSDLANNVASINLMKNDLMLLPKMLAFSKRTIGVIKQNLFWAFLYNVISIPIAAGMLYPFWGFQLSPMLASAAMALSSVSVVVNSLRLKNFELK